MTGGVHEALDRSCLVEYGTRVVQKRDGGSVYPVYGGGGATFKMDTFNREDRLVVSRFGMSEECTRFVAGKFFLNDSGLTVRPRDNRLAQRFLDYQILSLNDRIFELGKGSAQKNLDVPAFRQIGIFIPDSIADQQRIVAILDEAFDGIATTRANAEQNLQNARAIFESHLQAVFSQREEGWVVKRLGDVFTTATGTTPPKSNSELYGDFIPLVKPPELRDEAFDSAADGLSRLGAAVARTIPAQSVLVSCIGNLGKIGINTVPVAFNQQINAVLPNESLAIPEFMFFQSLSPVFKSQLESLASGTTVPIVNKSKFNSVSVVLPPLSIQRLVVTELSSIRDETQRLESLYQRKIDALDELKKSLLNQAFSGSL